jgi:heme exporter protein B
MKHFIHILALFKKELLLEIRQQYSFYGILLYVCCTLFVLYLSMGQPEAATWNGLFWMMQLFICVNAVAKSFLAEPRGRLLYYYTIAGSTDFILSKLLFNCLFMAVMSLISWMLFCILLGNPVIHGLRFFGLSLLGGLSLSLVFTFLSAIAARAQQHAGMMVILGFPILIPQILLLIKISNTVFLDIIQSGLLQTILLIICLDALVIVMALILFPFLWKD